MSPPVGILVDTLFEVIVTEQGPVVIRRHLNFTQLLDEHEFPSTYAPYIGPITTRVAFTVLV